MDLTSFIPVGAALLGGLLGFSGAIIASGRTTKATIEQARVSRLRERQYEVFTTVYGHVSVIFEIAYSDLALASNDEEVTKEVIALHEAVIELHRYTLINKLWIPTDIEEAATEFGNTVVRQKDLFVGKTTPLMRVSDPKYQQKQETFVQWMRTEGNQLRNQVYSQILDKLKKRPDIPHQIE